MATSITISSGSLLIGSPIVVSVGASNVGAATFHRVKLIVRAALSSDGEEKEYPLSTNASNGETVQFDISTALRSVASGYEYDLVAAAKEYPYLTYTIEAYDEYMLNGVLYETGKFIYNNGAKSYALMGAFTARERILSTNGTKDITAFTRKPATDEVCAPGELFVYPEAVATPLAINSTLTAGPKVTVVTLTGSGAKTYGGRTIYVDPNARDRMLFQFVNGLGVVETISAEMLEEVDSSGTTEVDVVTAPASFNTPRTEVARRDERKAIYKCSSGFVSKEWAEWWATEFLGGDPFRKGGRCKCWLLQGGNWFPCTVVPDDDITLYDRTSPGLIHVDFEVRVL